MMQQEAAVIVGFILLSLDIVGQNCTLAVEPQLLVKKSGVMHTAFSLTQSFSDPVVTRFFPSFPSHLFPIFFSVLRKRPIKM